MIGKIAFDSLTLISAHRSVRALNLRVESFSEESTWTVKLLYNSVRKFFAIVSFPANNSSRAARKGDRTTAFDLVLRNFAKSSFKFNFSPIIPVGASSSETKRRSLV